MEFNSRGTTGQAPVHRKHIDWAARTVRIELFILLLGCALILAAVSLWLGLTTTNPNQEYKNYVATNKYQAVFLNGTGNNANGSVFFGHIVKITDKYYVLDDIYFINSSSNTSNQSTNQNVAQITKFGCGDSAPYDQMVINRTQVALWENLKDSGKVVTAIKKYQQENPNGPNCAASSSSGTTSTPSTSANNTTH